MNFVRSSLRTHIIKSRSYGEFRSINYQNKTVLKVPMLRLFLSLFMIMSSFFFVESGLSQSNPNGCPEWCESQVRHLKPRPGDPNAGSKRRQYDIAFSDCMARTRGEKQCGAAPKKAPPRTQQASGCQDDSQCGRTQVCLKTQQNQPGRCENGYVEIDQARSGRFNVAFCNQQCSGKERCEYVGHGGVARKLLQCSGAVANANPAQEAAQQGLDPLGPVIQQCKQSTSQEFQGCRTRFSTAQQKCDTEKDSGINQYIDSMAQVSLQLGTLTSANIAAACSSAAALNQGAQGAVIAFRGICKTNRDSCVSGCQDTIKKFETCIVQLGTSAGLAGLGYDQASMLERARQDEDYQLLRTNFSTCQKLESKIAEADQAAQQFAMTMANAKQCRDLTDGGAQTHCAQNPKAPGCPGSADCSLPSNASSLACICSKNPNDPKCSTRGKTSAGINLNTGGIGAGSQGPRNPNLDLEGSGFAGLEKVAGQGGAGGGSPVDQLGSANVGGGQLSGDDGGSAGGDFAPESMDVNSGYFAGGGGSFGGGSSGAGFGGGDAGGGSDVNNGFYGSNPDGEAPHLADFLPNGERDPAMISAGQMPDGITGPTTNIWKKINFRYQAVEPTLLNQ